MIDTFKNLNIKDGMSGAEEAAVFSHRVKLLTLISLDAAWLCAHLGYVHTFQIRSCRVRRGFDRRFLTIDFKEETQICTKSATKSSPDPDWQHANVSLHCSIRVHGSSRCLSMSTLLFGGPFSNLVHLTEKMFARFPVKTTNIATENNIIVNRSVSFCVQADRGFHSSALRTEQRRGSRTHSVD